MQKNHQEAPEEAQLRSEALLAFRQTVTNHFSEYRRHMPWRDDTQPYYILVSEIMLQQTQVARVLPKFKTFIERFPDIQALAIAPLDQVIIAWSGLGYNRRARFLQAAASAIVNEYGGVFPRSQTELMKLPGVGVNTAGAIMAYAFNQPTIFVETNIRTVYLHHFFRGEQEVKDSSIRDLLAATIDNDQPRLWYWALMDYGSFLKSTAPSNLAQSKHYKKQSRFAGSLRQIRGLILRLLAARPLLGSDIEAAIEDQRWQEAADSLRRDGLVERRGKYFYLTGQRQVS